MVTQVESEIWGLQSRISPYPSFPPPSQHPLSSVPHLQDAGTAGYPSHFPNSCLLTLSPSCAFARTVDFLYKTDEEEKKYFALFLLRFIMLCVCLHACLPRSRGKLLGESQISLMSLEVMQNACAFTCSRVKPFCTNRKREVGRVSYLCFCRSRYPGCYWAS